MLYILLIAVGLLTPGHAVGQEPPCGSQAMTTITKADGSKVGLFISPAQISNAPSWTPESGEPPLAVSKAVRLATEWAKKEYNRFDAVQARAINLGTYGCPTPKDRWYYTVHFTPIVDSLPLLVPGYFAGVLMDGTVIGATPIK
jgi:hypothetical protein